MEFAVEPWAPDWGSPAPEEPSRAHVDVGVELVVQAWRPLRSTGPRAGTVAFVDGVRRIDAQVWVTGADGQPRAGLCASYAAGVVTCNGVARVERIEVRREVLCSVEGLRAIHTRHVRYQPQVGPAGSAERLGLMVQQRMRELEVGVTAASPDADLLVIDGPLRGRQRLPGAVGLVKSHEVAYLPPVVADVVGLLGPGERTPLFAMTTSWTRLSWYLRLPGPAGHDWAGIVRAEACADLPIAQASRLADLTAVTLPAFASAAHKDPRAPQNLYPIGGLERALRRRLGDPALLYRSLQTAAARPAPAAAAGRRRAILAPS